MDNKEFVRLMCAYNNACIQVGRLLEVRDRDLKAEEKEYVKEQLQHKNNERQSLQKQIYLLALEKEQ